MYHYDSNDTHAIPLYDYSAATYHKAYLSGIAMFQAANPSNNLVPTYEVADNAMTKTFIADLQRRGIACQLVPPHNHRTNNAERAVRTFKNHYIASLATCDPTFPMSEVPALVPQILLTLNLLRSSRLDPTITAYEQMHGPFDSNRYDLHPLGTRVITLDDPSQRLSFAPHGPIAYYVGPAMDHYRTYRVYVPTTKAFRNTDTVAWLSPTHLVEKYPTLPPGLFASEPTPVPNQQPSRPSVTTHLPNSEGADIPLPFAPTIAPCPPPSTPPPSPQSITNHPTSDPPPAIRSPIILPSAPRIHLTHPSMPEGVLLPPPQTAATPPPNSAFHAQPLDTIPRPLFAGATQAKIPYITYLRSIQGPKLPHWQASAHTEVLRLVEKTKTLELQPLDSQPPPDADVATVNPIIKEKLNPLDPTITDEYRTRWTWGHTSQTDTDEHPTSSSTIDTTAVKLMLNSVVSDHKAVLTTMDISDFYLHSKLDKPAYLWVPLRYLPPVSQHWLNVSHLPSDTKLLFKVNNALYGMDDAGRTAQRDLLRHLQPHGFYMCRHTPGLFRHRHRRIVFATWVDDIICKSDPSTNDLEFLLDVLQKKYPLKVDHNATAYLGYRIRLHRDQDPSLDTLKLNMPNYVKAGLSSLGFVSDSHPNSPIIYEAPIYGAAIQFEPIDDSPPASPEEQAYLRKAVGIFRYYAQAIDGTIILTVSRLASAQSKPTKKTMQMLHRFLNYMHHNPDAEIVYRPSDMQLHLHSDESYLSDPESRSRAAGFFTCGKIVFTGPENPSQVNGPIRTSSTIIPTVVGSAMEASYAAMYINAQDATVDRQTLIDLGHPQHSTIITYDNSTAGKLANGTAKVKRSKAVAMKYHWIQDRIQQGDFTIQWAPGKHNLADYPSKAHPVHHFRSHRKYFISFTSDNSPSLASSPERVC